MAGGDVVEGAWLLRAIETQPRIQPVLWGVPQPLKIGQAGGFEPKLG